MKITLNELRSLVKQVIREAKEEKSKKKGFDVSKIVEGYEESEVDRYSSANQNIDERLKAYAVENGEKYSEMKYEFMKLANRHNMKSPMKAYDAYFKIVNDFLSEEGY